MGRDRILALLVVGISLLSVLTCQAQTPNGTLSGTWKLTNIVLASGNPLLPAMQAELQNRSMVISGETSGGISDEELTQVGDSGKPMITCRQKATMTFTVARVANHNFLRRSAILLLPGKDCGPYPIDPALPCKGYGENTVWIITEADRSVTTILLPDEY